MQGWGVVGRLDEWGWGTSGGLGGWVFYLRATNERSGQGEPGTLDHRDTFRGSSALPVIAMRSSATGELVTVYKQLAGVLSWGGL